MARFRNSSTSGRVVHLVELPPRPPRRGRLHRGPGPLRPVLDEAPEQEPVEALRVVKVVPAAPPASPPAAPEKAPQPAPSPQAGEDGSPYQRQVGLLERRLRKLTQVLEEQEAMLTRMSSEPAQETGLASVYREVQGLNGGVPEAERKREMMRKIFEANLELRESTTG